MPKRLLPLLLIAAFVLSGCFKIDVTIAVDDDGSGTMDMIMAMDPSAMQGLGEMFESSGFDSSPPPDRETACGEIGSDVTDGDMPDGARIEPYDDGQFCGSRIMLPFDSPEDLATALDGAFSDDEELAADAGDISLERVGEGWHFEITTGGEEMVDTEEAPAFLVNALLGDAQLAYRVDLPGEPIEHNATSVDGSVYTWEIDIANPPERMFVRTGAASGGGVGWVGPLLAVLAIGALGAAAYWYWNNGRPVAAAGSPGSDNPVLQQPADWPVAPPQPAGVAASPPVVPPVPAPDPSIPAAPPLGETVFDPEPPAPPASPAPPGQ